MVLFWRCTVLEIKKFFFGTRNARKNVGCSRKLYDTIAEIRCSLGRYNDGTEVSSAWSDQSVFIYYFPLTRTECSRTKFIVQTTRKVHSTRLIRTNRNTVRRLHRNLFRFSLSIHNISMRPSWLHGRKQGVSTQPKHIIPFWKLQLKHFWKQSTLFSRQMTDKLTHFFFCAGARFDMALRNSLESIYGQTVKN